MEFIDKKIAVLGLGNENMALIQYLVKHGANDLTICDKKASEDILEYLKTEKTIKSRFGDDYLKDLEDFELIFRTPGLAYLAPEIQEAKNKGVIISSQTKLFLDKAPAMIIGVTGTKGKGTTSTLIYEMLRNSGKKVYLAGNIGNAPIEFLDNLDPSDIVILELSSFQLQDLEKSPHISVVLNVGIDHLDVHKNGKEYIDAKMNLVSHQNKDDFACINADYATSLKFADITRAQTYWFSCKLVDRGVWLKNDAEIFLRLDKTDQKIIETKEIALRGRHNWENVMAATLASALAGANLGAITKTVKEFRGLEHRIEPVAEINGANFYNDSFSTTPDTAVAAIKSFHEPIILIAGGSEKNADYTLLGKEIAVSTVKVLITIGVTGPRIKKAALDAGAKAKIIDNCKDFDEAINASLGEMHPGDVILLSPASASFDWFKNYKERGHQFREKILSIKSSN